MGSLASDIEGASSVANIAARHPVVIHVALATAIASAVIAASALITLRNPQSANMLPELWHWVEVNKTYINIVTLARFGAQRSSPDIDLIFVYASAPTVAAIIVSLWAYGFSGLKDLLGRLRPWIRRSDQSRALWTYVAIIVVYFAGMAACLVSLKLFGKPGLYQHALDDVGGSIATLVPTALIGAFLDEGGSLEELGWRGFVLPRMLEYFKSPLTAALVLGVIWWAWHFPREVPGLVMGTSLNMAFVTGQTVFLALVLALSIVSTYLVNMTGGSVIPAIMLHGGTNFWSKALQPIGAPFLWGFLDLRTAIVFILAIVVLIIAGPNLAYRPAKE
jgi:hypothetical protein